MNADYLAVVADDHFLGVFSQKEYSRDVILKDKNSADCEVHEVMCVSLPFVSPENTAEECMELMNVHGVHFLPVLEAGAFLGIISLDDVLHLAVLVKQALFDAEPVNKTSTA